MRIRSIKPEFWRSEDITSLPREYRLLFVGLWSYLDDNGVGVDDYRQIAADLFALEDDPKEARDYVREGLAILSRGLLIVRYEVAGKPLIYVPTWDKHQRVDRPNKERYPRPPSDWKPPTSEDAADDPHLRDVSRGSREGAATGAGEQGNRGTGEQTSFPTAAAARPKENPERDFDEFWAEYPLKRDKDDARKAYRKVLKEKRASPDQLCVAAGRYAVERRGQDPKYTKYPATWLNKGTYLNFFFADAEVVPFARASGGYEPYRNPTDDAVWDEPLIPGE